jgi:hypothetical protein
MDAFSFKMSRHTVHAVEERSSLTPLPSQPCRLNLTLDEEARTSSAITGGEYAARRSRILRSSSSYDFCSMHLFRASVADDDQFRTLPQRPSLRSVLLPFRNTMPEVVGIDRRVQASAAHGMHVARIREGELGKTDMGLPCTTRTAQDGQDFRPKGCVHPAHGKTRSSKIVSSFVWEPGKCKTITECATRRRLYEPTLPPGWVEAAPPRIDFIAGENGNGEPQNKCLCPT